jgi:hypothetical protein
LTPSQFPQTKMVALPRCHLLLRPCGNNRSFNVANESSGCGDVARTSKKNPQEG